MVQEDSQVKAGGGNVWPEVGCSVGMALVNYVMGHIQGKAYTFIVYLEQELSEKRQHVWTLLCDIDPRNLMQGENEHYKETYRLCIQVCADTDALKSGGGTSDINS